MITPGRAMRVGIFGGTFDPPHVGHLIAAGDACDVLGLDTLLFVPTATQPLKADQGVASAADRLAMVRLAIAGDPVSATARRDRIATKMTPAQIDAAKKLVAAYKPPKK